MTEKTKVVHIELEWFTLKADEIRRTADDMKRQMIGVIRTIESNLDFLEHQLTPALTQEAVQRQRGYLSDLSALTVKLDTIKTDAEKIAKEVKRLKGKTILPFP